MAAEDGVALAQALLRIGLSSEIPEALSTFEAVPVKRAGQIQEASVLNGILWHVADGPLQETGDAAMLPETLGVSSSHSLTSGAIQRHRCGIMVTILKGNRQGIRVKKVYD
jgi:salicylate hydroxylase